MGLRGYFGYQDGWAASAGLRTLADVNGDGFADIVGFKGGVQVALGSDQPPFLKAPTQWSSSYDEGWTVLATPRMLADVDGDGLSDVVGFGPDGVLTALSTGSSFETTQWKDNPLPYFKSGDWPGQTYPRLMADVNGDGLADIVGFKDGVSVSISLGDRFDTPKQWSPHFGDGDGLATWTVFTPRLLSDVNGDHRADVVGFNLDGVYVALSTGTAFELAEWAMPFPQFTQRQGWDLRTNALLVSDVNGDGQADLLGSNPQGVWVALATGKGFVGPGPTPWTTSFNFPSPEWSVGTTPLEIGDFNADGLGDLIGFGPAGVQVGLSTGGSFDLESWDQKSLLAFGRNQGWTAATPRLVGDVNGDGLNDVVGFFQRDVALGITSGPYPGLVESLVDGLGRRYTLQYSPLSESEVYTPGAAGPAPSASAAGVTALLSFGLSRLYDYPMPLGTPTASQHVLASAYPIRPAVGSRYVVASYGETQDAAINSLGFDYSYRLHYADGRFELGGRGWLGFASITTVDGEARAGGPQSGRVATTSYLQIWPETGKIAARAVRCGGSAPYDPRCTSAGLLLDEKTWGYEAAQTATGIEDSRPPVFDVRPVARQQNFYTYGTHDFSLGEAATYDDFGSLTLASYMGLVDLQGHDESTDDDVYTISSYLDQTGSTGWRLGFLLARKRSSLSTSGLESFDDATDLTFTLRGYDDPATMNVTSVSRWDDQNDLWLTTFLGYDRFGNRVTLTSPAGATTTTTYDDAYHTYADVRTSPADIRGIALKAAFGYDPATGRLVARTGPNGLAPEHPLSDTTIFSYDAFDRLAARQGPPPDVAGVVTDANRVTPRVTGSTDWSTAPVVTLESVAWGSDQDLGGPAAIYRRTATLQDWPTAETRVTRWDKGYLDARGRRYLTLTQGDPATGNVVRATEFDAANRVRSRTVPGFTAGSSRASVTVPTLGTTTAYDVYGRPTRTETPRGKNGNLRAVETASYPDRRTQTITHASGQPYAYPQTLSYTYHDGRRRLSRVQGADKADLATTFGYDRLGRLVSAVDPGGVLTEVAYDSLGGRTRLSSQDFGNEDELSGSILYDYDDQGRLRTETTPAGSTRYAAYDALGRVLEVLLPAGQCVVNGGADVPAPARLEYSYDDPAAAHGLGRLTAVTAVLPGGTNQSRTSIGYDAYGRPASESTSIEGRPEPFVWLRRRDPLGRIVQRTYPDSARTVLVTEYENGNLVSQTLAGDTLVTFPASAYNPFGAPGTIARANGVTTRLEFSPAGIPYSRTIGTPNARPYLSEVYTWDLLDRRKSQAPPDPVASSPAVTWDYEALRLTAASGPIEARTYDYSIDGNTTRIDDTSYDYRAHQVVSGTAGGEAIYRATYYPGGAVETRTLDGDLSAALSHCYDGIGRLSAVYRSNERIASYAYDPEGRRIRKTGSDGTLTYYAGPDYVLEVSPSGAETETLLIPDQQGPTVSATRSTASADGHPEILYLHQDLVASTVLTTGPTGQPVDEIAYAPYGRFDVVVGTGDVRPKFAARAYEPEVGLYYFGARYLDPATGRFLTPDSGLASNLARQDTLNRYAYVAGDPINFVDPSGSQIEAALLELYHANLRRDAMTDLYAQEYPGAVRALRTAEQAVTDLNNLAHAYQRIDIGDGDLVRRIADRLTVQADDIQRMLRFNPFARAPGPLPRGALRQQGGPEERDIVVDELRDRFNRQRLAGNLDEAQALREIDAHTAEAVRTSERLEDWTEAMRQVTGTLDRASGRALVPHLDELDLVDQLGGEYATTLVEEAVEILF